MNRIEQNNTEPSQTSWFWVIVFILGAMLLAGDYSWKSSRFVPSIHDETSYLFQARTFLLGRVTNPVHPEHLFFDQYHVINEGVYASKYFPGFALTLMPFVLMGQPYFNPIFFYGIELLLIFLIGKELYGKKAAWLAMIIAAISPQILMQNCFLLSHVPNAVFSLLFFYGFIQSEENEKLGWIPVAAASWGMSFLIRPVTAIGFALPIGLFLIWKLLRKELVHPAKKIMLWLTPVLLFVLANFIYNKAVTGHYLKSPFDYYAEIHAPFHRYGFHVWEKYAEQAKGPRVDKRFNEFYHDHTPLIGLQFTGLRLSVFTTFLFGQTVLGVFFLGLWLINLRKRNPWDLLIFSIWISLQAFYLPHWYPGVLTFGSNYLYESTGLILIAIVNTVLILLQHPKLIPYQKWLGIAMLAICVSCSSLLVRDLSHEVLGLKSLKFWIYRQITDRKIDRAVVFLKLPEKPQINWDITDNVPTLNSRLVFAHDRGSEDQKLKPYFKGYTFLVWDVEKGTLETI